MSNLKALQEVKDLKGLVKDILTRNREARDNNNALIIDVWTHQDEELDSMFTTFKSFSIRFAKRQYCPADSITRLSRLLQSDHPELRGKLWKERKTQLEPEFRLGIVKV